MTPKPVQWLEAAGSSNDGQSRLIGTRKYRLDFEAGALLTVYDFWSISIVDARTRANSIERYSVGDWSEGLVHGDDGFLSLYLQHAPPASGTRNWVPTPSGSFLAELRLYELPAGVSGKAGAVHSFILSSDEAGGVETTSPG